MLVYVHGFNNTHFQAIEQAAQIAADLGVQNATGSALHLRVVVVSWASWGTSNPFFYFRDEEIARLSLPLLGAVLRKLLYGRPTGSSKTPGTEVSWCCLSFHRLHLVRI